MINNQQRTIPVNSDALCSLLFSALRRDPFRDHGYESWVLGQYRFRY
jgi:hypothetical protein